MSSYQTAFTLPVPLASVVPAAAMAAGNVGLTVRAQTPYALKCRSGLTFTTYPVTIEITVSGVDGAAYVNVYAHNFGWGPLQSGACSQRATKLIGAMSYILQGWAQQAAAQAAMSGGSGPQPI
jgi:hypothetical protein